MDKEAQREAYVAHINENGEEQSVRDHLYGTAKRAAAFAAVFQGEKHAEVIGLMHDIGKYSEGFQNRIRNQGKIVDHSTAGAVERIEKKDLVGALCIAGHHGGLPNCGTFSDSGDEATLHGRIKRKAAGKLGDYSEFHKDISAEDLSEAQMGLFSADKEGFLRAYFYTKFLFSALTDADFLDTEAFMGGRERNYFYEDIANLSEKLDRYTEKWGEPKTELNRIRCEILEACRIRGTDPRGLFSLTVPTGGGKTTASLAFALKHAKEHSMERIIYVIPYTSIIEQNVEVFQDILGSENVLAHYGDVSYDDQDGASQKKLAAENWDAPVIVTTSVQFFESLFSNKPSKCRKLHNIANSVIIFDEYQMIPVKHMFLCTEAIYRLIQSYRCTALLCTATQPGTKRFFHEMTCREIIEDTEKLFEQLKRVSYHEIGRIEEEELDVRLNKHRQVLCIVNTRKKAQRIYEGMEEDGNYHLSTLMVPRHRSEVLEKVRNRLKNGLTCRVISTSLIEAGVDVDFPILYREESGLDSIVQAAGRCNREGRASAEESCVYVFRLGESQWNLQRINRDAMREVLSLGYQIGLPDTTKRYFEALFDSKGDQALDGDDILKMICEGGKTGPLPFREVAERFKMIDQDTRTIYVPFDSHGEELCRRLSEGERTRMLFRELGQYSVNLYPRDYALLETQGILLEYDEDAAVLSDLSYYSKDTGLLLMDAEEGQGCFI